MIILALDLSTKSSGYSVFDDNKLITYGLAASTKANVYDRIEIITKRIQEIVKEYNPTKIIAEQPEPAFVKNNIDVYRKLTFVHGSICMMLRHYKLQMELYTSSHWRKMVGIHTGRGIKRTQLKAKDIEEANKLFPQIKTKSDDVADAILIGLAYVKQRNLDQLNWG